MNLLAEQLAGCSTAALFDVLRLHGLPVHELPRQIRALAPAIKLAGPVFTVTGRPDPAISAQEALELLISKGLSGAPPGHVVVCQPHDHARLVMRHLAAEALRSCGIRGYYIDGGSRDAHDIGEMGFPVFSRYASPVEVAGSWRLEATGVPVVIGGVTVSPSDYLLGDCDGTLLIDKAHAEFVISEAVKTMHADSRVRNAIRTNWNPCDAFLQFGRL